MEVKSPSCVWLFVTPWNVAYQAPQSMEFSRQEYWSGLPFPSPGPLPDPGIKSGSPALQAGALPSEPPGKPNTKKRCPFHHRGLECRSWKSKYTWSSRQVWSWNAEWSRTKAKRVWPREHTGHRKHPLATTQEKTLHMNITRWSTLKSDWLYSLQPKMEKLYTVSKNKTGSWLWLRSWTPYCQIQT